jgi:hypothetical protein
MAKAAATAAAAAAAAFNEASSVRGQGKSNSSS